MMFKIISVAGLIGMIGVISCSFNSQPDQQDIGQIQEEDQNLVYVSGDDQEMNRAIDFAREKLDFFIENLLDHQNDQLTFLIKAAFPAEQSDDVEHLWISEVSYDQGTFRGIISNEPQIIKDLTCGQWVEVPVNKVTDWMIINPDGSVTGGYTIKVLRNRMTEQQRLEFDRQTGLMFQ